MNFIQKVRSIYALADGVVVDRSHDIPYLCGYSKDGTTVYFDKDLPEELEIDGKPFDVTEPLEVHELTEWVLEHHLGYSYQKAHRLAIKDEEQLVKQKKHSPAAYEKALKKYIKHAEEKTKVDLPEDLDRIPYKDDPKYGVWFGLDERSSSG